MSGGIPMKAKLGALGCALLLVAGWAGQSQAKSDSGTRKSRDAAPAAHGQRLDTSVLRAGHADYISFATPAKLAKARAGSGGTVVVGVVEGFERGRRLFSFDDEPMNRVVMRVRVGETITGDSRYVYGGRAYFELWGGVGWADPSERFRRAIPAGTPVVVFGATKFVPSDSRTQGVDDGHPKGTRVQSATHPQSLLFEESRTVRGQKQTRLVGGREDLDEFGTGWSRHATLEDLVAAMKRELG
ncbi:hypothetical protein ACH35V_02390 [Actinomadura sp. 1N219]|uniref:hypothetical protein n=1 Tax=Actinomadura sp. 1N219 TaxID=3375152 RepID=UPI00379D11D9